VRPAFTDSSPNVPYAAACKSTLLAVRRSSAKVSTEMTTARICPCLVSTNFSESPCSRRSTIRFSSRIASRTVRSSSLDTSTLPNVASRRRQIAFGVLILGSVVDGNPEARTVMSHFPSDRSSKMSVMPQFGRNETRLRAKEGLNMNEINMDAEDNIDGELALATDTTVGPLDSGGRRCI
jgi:hypothetical protein